MIDRQLACCFSGHRFIPPELTADISENLIRLISAAINDGISDFITGGALGFDTLAAQTVLKLKETQPSLRLILALPCRTQADRWKKRDRLIYEDILSRSDEVHYISDQYTPDCMMRRNRFMADNSRRCIFYLSRSGSGTYKTVSYAMENGLELFNVLTD